ncbi:lectin-like protein, partial [Trifolium medium]|nr:lectin-like protein [Trifolium medium]
MTSNGHSLGDGIAFFIVPYNSSIPESSGGGYLGLFDSFFALDALRNGISPVVAVDFDTYSNEWDPPFAH